MNNSLPWPQKGDQLFVEGTDWYHNACLNFTSERFPLYIKGYKEAADKLVMSVMEDRSHLDFIILPIIFLYRQFLELNVKYLVREGNRLLDVAPMSKTGFSGGHDLPFLWKECKAVLVQIGSHYPELQISKDVLNAVGQLLTEFSQMDQGSDSFRYPVDRDNNLSTPGDQKLINVRHLAEVMQKLATFFEAASAALLDYLDLKQDMEHDSIP